MTLGAANSHALQRVILELRHVSISSAESERKGLPDEQEGTEKNIGLRNTTKTDWPPSAESVASAESSFLRCIQKRDYPRSDSPPSYQEKECNTQTVRVVTSHRLPCRSWCPCACHKRRNLKLVAPGLLEGVLGRLFVGYAGLPLPKDPCDFRGCADQQQATTTVEYWFPTWLVARKLKVQLAYLPNVGPELYLSMTRRVPDTSQSITFAMQGNIEGLKGLFVQGLAGPRDVSDSRGYSLMRWALYGGMHNYETVRFLINEGAKVDEISYDNVWDYLIRGKCTATQQNALRCITEGGEGDWIEEQNFPLVHRIIFGLSSKPLATELEENPYAVHLTDAQNRTALDWATARVQLDDMALLVQYGADPNNMDLTGRTPVLHAVDSHDANGLQVILMAGGDPNPEYPKGIFRSSPLTAAGFSGMVTLLKLLLDFEASPNACNPEGFTALHAVARTHNTECAVLLLEHGADLHAMSTNGRTPLTTAIIHNSHPVLELFMQRYHEYINSVPIKGPSILSVVAEFADLKTLQVLTSVQPLMVAYDVSLHGVGESRKVLEKRPDYNDKLAGAFEELIAIATAEAEEAKSVDSVLETGLFYSAKSPFHSELAGAVDALASVEVSPTDSGGGQWEDEREHFYSPTSPYTRDHFVHSPASPMAREAVDALSSPSIEHFQATSSPLKQQESQ